MWECVNVSLLSKTEENGLCEIGGKSGEQIGCSVVCA